jgi:hypothetical protein
VIEDEVKVCAVLRHFKADKPFLRFEGFCINELKPFIYGTGGVGY